VVDACAALDVEWVEPEEAAWAAACAIGMINLPIDEEDTRELELPSQGEFRFDAGLPYSSRMDQCEDAAWAGDSQAQHSLGLLLYSGVGGAEKDERMSACWHAAAAAQGNIDALAVLGGCVRRGVGADQDERAGIACIEAAAAAGSPGGLVKLGSLHDEGALGSGHPGPYAAARLFSRAASQGSALGLFNYGWSLTYGIGAPRDVKRGFAAWRAAAACAPDDGAEEAAFMMYEEQALLTPRQKKIIEPDRCLRLAAALEFAPALEALEARESAGEELEFAGPPKKDRFIRNDKARSWTMGDERAEALLDGL